MSSEPCIHLSTCCPKCKFKAKYTKIMAKHSLPVLFWPIIPIYKDRCQHCQTSNQQRHVHVQSQVLKLASYLTSLYLLYLAQLELTRNKGGQVVYLSTWTSNPSPLVTLFQNKYPASGCLWHAPVIMEF